MSKKIHSAKWPPSNKAPQLSLPKVYLFNFCNISHTKSLLVLLCPHCIAPPPRRTHGQMCHNTHRVDMTERCAAEEDSAVPRWQTPILFVQQPAFNHTLLSSFHLSPLFQSSTLFSSCSWQWRWKDFWGYHSSSHPSSFCRWFTASPSSMLAVKGLLLSPWSFLVLPYQLYIPVYLFNPFSDNILFLSLPFTHVSYLGGYKLHLQVSQPWLQRKTWLNIKVLIFKKKKRKSTASFFILPAAHSLGFASNNSIGVHVKTQNHTSELLPGYNTFVNKTDFVNVPEFWKRYTNAFHSSFHSLQVSTLAHFAILLSFSSS